MNEDPAAQNDLMASRLMEQVRDLYILPELERRREAGHPLQEGELFKVQVIMNLDKDTEVRFNDEVRAVAKARVTRPVQAGEPITAADLGEVVEIELTDHDPDAGHITMIRNQTTWYIHFDFRYNAGRARETAEVAREFLESAESAESAAKDGRFRPFVDNLYSAAELMAKATLLVMPDEKVLTAKKHGYIVSRFNGWANLGNTDQRFADLLNRLGNLRPAARYLRRPVQVSSDDATKMLEVAREMLAHVGAQIPRRQSIRELADDGTDEG